MELDFTKKILEMFASRPGPKSGAQTPSKPEERKKGSSKNEPGSAGTSPDSKEKSKKILKKLSLNSKIFLEIGFAIRLKLIRI